MLPCPSCGARLPPASGPVHAYLHASPACFAAFNTLLAAEYSAYSNPSLRAIHRLTVDTWAVQHPGSPDDRRAVQSTGLHLARLLVQLESPRPPQETNQVMLDFSAHKATLEPLEPPTAFHVTVADVAPFAGTEQHAHKVRAWAEATWRDWAPHHAAIRKWVAKYSVHGAPRESQG